MSGYVPLFSSLTTGTLCGRWPDVGLWPIVLSLGNRHGVVDVTPAFISSVTGLPAAEVIACMKRFCEPDPHSRSSESEGARLRLIDEHREWGWLIVNHGKYRERARLQAKNAAEVASGKNAARLKQAPPPTADDRRSSPSNAPQTQTQTQTETKESEKKQRASRLPDDWVLNQERDAVAKAEGLDAQRTYEKFCDYWRSVSGSKATKLDWDATWRNWCKTERDNRRQSVGTVEHRQAREFPS